MTRVFLHYVDADFDFLASPEGQPLPLYTAEPVLCPDDVEGSVDIPPELWERWLRVSAEFKAVQQALDPYKDP